MAGFHPLDWAMDTVKGWIGSALLAGENWAANEAEQLAEKAIDVAAPVVRPVVDTARGALGANGAGNTLPPSSFDSFLSQGRTGGGVSQTQQAPDFVVIGDSIACGLEGTGHPGVCDPRVGAKPSEILANIKTTLQNDPNAVRGKTVVLSSGMSNNYEPAAVKEQVELLTAAGAKVMLVGVGERPDIAPRNRDLQEIAKAPGVTFVPLSETGPDHVHPKNYNDLWSNVTTAYAKANGQSQPFSSQAQTNNPPQEESFWDKAKRFLGIGGKQPSASAPAPGDDDDGGGLLGGIMNMVTKIPIIGPILGALIAVIGLIFTAISGMFGGGEGSGLGGLMSGIGSFFNATRGRDDGTAPAAVANQAVRDEKGAVSQVKQGVSEFFHGSFRQGASDIYHGADNVLRGGTHATTGLSREIEAVHYLQSKGMSKEHASGVVANLFSESGLNPNLYGGGAEAKGGKSEAYGLAQWHKDRLEALERAGFKIKGGTMEQQLDAVYYEMTQGNERAAGQQISQTRTAAEAGAVCSDCYERPGLTAKDKRDAANARAQKAESILMAVNQQESGTNVHTIDGPLTTPQVAVGSAELASIPG